MFSVLGFMAKTLNVEVGEVVTSGELCNYSASKRRIPPLVPSPLVSSLHFNNWLNHSFVICIRSWPCLRGLPRSHCTDACQHLVGYLVLLYAPDSWLGQPGKFSHYKCTL